MRIDEDQPTRTLLDEEIAKIELLLNDLVPKVNRYEALKLSLQNLKKWREAVSRGLV